MRLSSSLAVRITGALVAATVLTAAGLLGGIYYFSVARPMAEVREKIRSEAGSLQSVYRERGEEALVAALVERREMSAADKPFDAFLDRDGRLISGNLPSWPVARQGDWATIEADLYRDGDEDDHEALSRDMLLGDGRRLIVGRDVELLADREEVIIEALLWSSVSVILFSLLAGLMTSWAIAGRLEAVNRTARAVRQGNLSMRVPIRGKGDDFDQLGQSLNAMLDRNEELLASLGRVSDNIAHELRTPLARLQTSLEPAPGSNRLEPAQIEAARLEAERLQQIFDALLRIARIDTGRHQLASEAVELDSIVSDAVELYEPAAAERSQTLALFLVPCTIWGDRNLLFQAVSNLLDNAIKFSPDGSQIGVELARNGSSARIVVTDSGAGVEEKYQARLAERFFRAPGSDEVAGTGLGLTLVNAIAGAHGGTLTFASLPGGFSATLSLPVKLEGGHGK